MSWQTRPGARSSALFLDGDVFVHRRAVGDDEAFDLLGHAEHVELLAEVDRRGCVMEQLGEFVQLREALVDVGLFIAGHQLGGQRLVAIEAVGPQARIDLHRPRHVVIGCGIERQDKAVGFLVPSAAEIGLHPTAEGDDSQRGLHTDLAELTGKAFEDAAVAGRAIHHHLEVHRKPIRIPGLGQQRLGFRRVVRVRLDVGVVADDLARGRLAGRRAQAPQQRLVDRRLIDGVVQRLTDTHILQRGIGTALDAQAHRHDRHGRPHRADHAGGLDGIDVVHADVAGDVDLAGQQRLHACGIIRQVDND